MEKKYPIDSNGVPVVNRKDVEEKAEELLVFFDESLLETPKEIPLLDICDKLEKEFDVRFHYNVNLNLKNDRNKIILGKCSPNELKIFVDISISNNINIFNFTLGHEIGHLVFHQGLKLKQPFPPDDQEVIERDYVTGRKILKTALDWLEWQANRFSAALLMPRATFQYAVVKTQEQMGINRNIGFVYVENEGYSIKDFEDVKSRLSSFYKVSRMAIEYRMNDLGILFDRRNRSMKHISELFRKK